MTDRVTLQFDLVQYDAGDGPCVAALGGEMIRIGYLAADERFPRFARGAADRPVQSVLSTPAIDHGHVVGSLNPYSHDVDAFDDQTQDIALVMAAEVAHALVRSAVLSTARTTREQLQAQHAKPLWSLAPKASSSRSRTAAPPKPATSSATPPATTASNCASQQNGSWPPSATTSPR
jgi:GAF domain-containing protein